MTTSTVERLKDFETKLNRSIFDRSFAEALDELDELKDFQKEFLFPKTQNGKRPNYLCGNSLGLQPANLRTEVNTYLDKWANEAVEGHFTGEDMWVEGESVLKTKMAKLVGAKDTEVVIMNSLTINLHLMLVSFYRPTATRFKIVIEKKAFPSDYHAVISQLQFHGYSPETALIEVTPREGEDCLRQEDIEAIIRAEGPSIALILFTGIQYYTGQLFDLQLIAKLGHEKGCIVGYDLAHAVGNVPLELHEWGCDFACWCMYKYMNCGPGSIAGCFVHEKHGNPTLHYSEDSKYPVPEPIRFAGWWGHRKSDRFAMEPVFLPSDGADGFRVSNPPMIAVACVKASLDIFDRAGMENLRKKSVLLTGYMEYLLRNKLKDQIKIITPESRGSHLSMTFSANVHGKAVTAEEVLEKLKVEGVFGDVRKPNVIRITPTALYNSFIDVYEFVEILHEVLTRE